MKKLLALVLVCLMLATLSVTAFADTQNGELLDIAQVMVKAAMNKAEEINVPMVITVMDMDGNVVLFHRMKGSLLASMEISQNKAYTAVALKMPSETVKDLAIEGAELQSIAVQHAGKIVEFGGGFPIINPDGVQIGGIGVSGGSVAEDTSVAEAGLAAYEEGTDPELTASGGELLDKAMVMVQAAQEKAVEIDVPMVISVCDIAIEGAELQGIAVQHAGRIVEFGGGIPIFNEDGVQIGGIGVSGGSVAEDTSVAEAGLAALG